MKRFISVSTISCKNNYKDLIIIVIKKAIKNLNIIYVIYISYHLGDNLKKNTSKVFVHQFISRLEENMEIFEVNINKNIHDVTEKKNFIIQKSFIFH